MTKKRGAKRLTGYQESVLITLRMMELGVKTDMNSPILLVPSTAFEVIGGTGTGKWHRDKLHELVSLSWITEEQLNGTWFYALTDAARVTIDDRMRQAIKHCHISWKASF